MLYPKQLQMNLKNRAIGGVDAYNMHAHGLRFGLVREDQLVFYVGSPAILSLLFDEILERKTDLILDDAFDIGADQPLIQ